jgi:BirA family biotin operon repressor/biotin-[acetyl-CoA-carboxylase] ligase
VKQDVTLHRYPSLPSTNARLLELAEQGAPEGTGVTAEEQTAGRGRNGRTWHSPPGNLYISVLLRPALPPRALGRLSILSGLALIEALERPGAPFALKWPNDLLLGGRKVAGMLLEARTLGETVQAVVAGAGVNFALDAARLPAELAGRVATLAEWGDWDRDRVARDLMEGLPRRARDWRGEAWERARASWWERAWKPPLVKVAGEEGELAGLSVGLDGEGALLVETAAGVFPARTGELVSEGRCDGGQDGK